MREMELSKIYPIAGFLTSAVFAILWVVSMAAFGHWTFGHHTLSDLGVCGDQAAEIAFNMACVFSGSFGIIMGLGMTNLKGIMGYCGVTVILCSIFLIGIGIVTLRYGDSHFFVATSYGVVVSLCMVLSVIGDYLDGRRNYALVTVILLIICATLALFQTFEVFEPIAVCCALLWVAIQSFKYFRIEYQI